MEKETIGTLLAIITAFFSGIAIQVNKIFVVSLDLKFGDLLVSEFITGV